MFKGQAACSLIKALYPNEQWFLTLPLFQLAWWWFKIDKCRTTNLSTSKLIRRRAPYIKALSITPIQGIQTQKSTCWTQTLSSKSRTEYIIACSKRSTISRDNRDWYFPRSHARCPGAYRSETLGPLWDNHRFPNANVGNSNSWHGDCNTVRRPYQAFWQRVC